MWKRRTYDEGVGRYNGWDETAHEDFGFSFAGSCIADHVFFCCSGWHRSCLGRETRESILDIQLLSCT